MPHRRIFCLFFFAIKLSSIFGQKLPLNLEACSNWQRIYDQQLSKDGKYVMYLFGSTDGPKQVIIESVNGLFKKKIPTKRTTTNMLNTDCCHLVFMNSEDSLAIFDFANKQIKYFDNTVSFKIASKGEGRWLARLLPNNRLMLHDFFLNKEESYDNVSEYLFNDLGTALLLLRESKNGSGGIKFLQWVELKTGNASTIWQGSTASRFVFDDLGRQLAFIATEKNKQNLATNRIWYYQCDHSATKLISDKSEIPEEEFSISNTQLSFSPNGKKLFFGISLLRAQTLTNTKLASVDVWHYHDDDLQPQLMDNWLGTKNRSFKAVFNFETRKTYRLEEENSNIFRLSSDSNNAYGLYDTKVNIQEGYRRREGRPDIYLVNTNNGTLTRIKKQLDYTQWLNFSPQAKYVYWFDKKQKSFFAYNINSGATKNISSKVPNSIYDVQSDEPSIDKCYGVVGWLQNDRGILVYDQYDIWQLDPDGIASPINVTNGFGKRKKIILRYVYFNDKYFAREPAIKPDTSLLLCAFNASTKENGFFRKQLGVAGDPQELTMSNDFYYFSTNLPGKEIPRPKVLKAEQANVFLVTRMNSNSYPNVYMTNDFRSFNPLSDFSPQRTYNWLTTELFHWKKFDGSTGEALLYKPENFDTQKKYPVIFYIYDRMSAGLNKFTEVMLSRGDLNIPFFVSNGYIVVCPDIQYKLNGDPGESVYNCVISAVNALQVKPWINRNAIAIHGHSWGGFEVNYLVTRTNRLAAAVAAAGVSDMISNSAALFMDRKDGHGVVEQGSYRMITTLWANRDSYIKNSAVYNANKVKTPLLIFHNKKDGNVPWMQGVEMFSSLRRLSKPVWMLQYDNGNHSLYEKADMVDFTKRLVQFYDHFLKGAPAPTWMSRGISVRLKQIETGYAYDPAGNCGKDCKVCKMWNEKMKKDSAGTWKEIEEKTKSEHWIGGGSD